MRFTQIILPAFLAATSYAGSAQIHLYTDPINCPDTAEIQQPGLGIPAGPFVSNADLPCNYLYGPSYKGVTSSLRSVKVTGQNVSLPDPSDSCVCPLTKRLLVRYHVVFEPRLLRPWVRCSRPRLLSRLCGGKSHRLSLAVLLSLEFNMLWYLVMYSV